MKAKKGLLFLLLALLCGCLLLTACNLTPPEDPVKPDDDTPKKDESLLYLAEEREMKYCFVYTAETGYETTSAVNKVRSDLKSLGYTVLSNGTESNTNADLEIIVGTASTRNGCYVDAHSLGDGGWVIKSVGDRIVIAGGTDEATALAIDSFFHKLNFGSGMITLKRDEFELVRPKYGITSVKIGETPLSDFKILATQGNDDTYACALRFQSKLYAEAGIWLNIFPLGTKVDHPFIFRVTDDAAGMLFRAEEKDGSFILESASKTVYLSFYEDFEDKFFRKTGDVVFATGYCDEIGKTVLKYSDFGAKGDGKTDDFEAIRKTHLIANEAQIKVEADEGATYYIGLTTVTCPIRTDVDWKDAKFIIDDSVVGTQYRTVQIFTVEPSYAVKSIGASELKNKNYTLKAGATNVGMKFDADSLLHLCWTGKKIYIRWGINENEGSNQSEVILVDRDGNVDPSTPVLWDYDGMEWIRIIRADETPITIEGGTFTTIANTAPRLYTYYSRGILVNRSNTTVKNITHTVEKEGDTGAPYNGFFDATDATNVLFENLKVVGHKTYRLETDYNNTMGSYDLSSSYSNALTYRNVVQTNDILKPQTELWGVHGSNFNKNFSVYNCTLSRFDAHCGMVNCTVVDTTFGQYFNCIGFGTLYVKNVHRLAGSGFITLRADYGSTWNGDAQLIDCSMDYTGTSYLFTASYKPGWDFGYTCYLPQNITVENFTYQGSTCYVFNNITSDCLTDPVNPYQITKTVTFKNNAKTIKLCPTASNATFAGTKVNYA